MSTTVGRHAEAVAARWLESQGYQIQQLNWRTRYCEIDIVAIKRDVAYFVEVKYRRSLTQGGGLDYVTDTKLKQMSFAAESWIAANSWSGELRLSALEVTGEDFGITSFIETL